jgi:putative transcriptional regulator
MQGTETVTILHAGHGILARALMLVALLGGMGATRAQTPAANGVDGDEPDSVVLVAAPNLIDPQYRQTVIIATRVDGDRHIGIIVNRPTRRSLASLFPEHAPSQAVIAPVYFGGPMARTAVFAVARGDMQRQPGVVPLLKGLYLALTVTLVDDVIEHHPNDARYYLGNVQWRSGELRDELRRGVWNVLNADPSVVFSDDPERLWERLSQLARSGMTQRSPDLLLQRTAHAPT